MSDWRPTMDQRRKYNLTPYIREDGVWVVDQLAWSGTCTGCGETILISEDIDRPSAALMYPGTTYRVVGSSYDRHPCKGQPYRLTRPLNADDMAHPMIDARFVPEDGGSLWEAGVR